MELVILGMLLGSGLVLAIQELKRQRFALIARREAAFNAAVRAAVARRHVSYGGDSPALAQTSTPDTAWW